MSEIASLPLGDSAQPTSRATLVLSADGNVRLEPSPEMRDALAQEEGRLLNLSDRWGVRLGGALTAAGVLICATGWLLGRVWGKSASASLWPTKFKNLHLLRGGNGEWLVRLHGKTHSVDADAETIELFAAQAEELKSGGRSDHGLP